MRITFLATQVLCFSYEQVKNNHLKQLRHLLKSPSYGFSNPDKTLRKVLPDPEPPKIDIISHLKH